MKALRNSFTSKMLLMPAIVSITFFLVFLGMRTPNVPRTSASKAQIRAVVESQTKAAQTGIEKNGQTADVCRCVALPATLPVRVSICRFEDGTTPANVVLTIPSRAPPAFRA